MSSVKQVAESPLSKNGGHSVLFIVCDNQVRYKASEVLLRASEDVEDIEKNFSAHFKKIVTRNLYLIAKSRNNTEFTHLKQHTISNFSKLIEVGIKILRG
jgi:hypothetical protein